MYLVEKEKGNNSNITIINQDTKASVIIGKMTMEIIDILEEEGYEFNKDLGEDSHISLTDKWNLEVSESTGRKLSSTAFKMKKPITVKTSKLTELVAEPPKKSNKTIDAVDVLLGLTSYN